MESFADVEGLGKRWSPKNVAKKMFIPPSPKSVGKFLKKGPPKPPGFNRLPKPSPFSRPRDRKGMARKFLTGGLGEQGIEAIEAGSYADVDVALGKSFLKKLKSISVKKVAGKSVTSGLRVARGTIGFKKGLTAKQLKVAKKIRGPVVAVAAIAAVAVATYFTGGAALTLLKGAGGKLLKAAASKAKMDPSKLAGLYSKAHKMRQDLGLPPVSMDTYASDIARIKSANPGMSDEEAASAAAGEERVTITADSAAAIAETKAVVAEAAAIAPAQVAGAMRSQGVTSSEFAGSITEEAPATGGTEPEAQQTGSASGEMAPSAGGFDVKKMAPLLAVAAAGLFIVFRKK